MLRRSGELRGQRELDSRREFESWWKDSYSADVVSTQSHGTDYNQRHPNQEVGADDQKQATSDNHLVLPEKIVCSF